MANGYQPSPQQLQSFQQQRYVRDPFLIYSECAPIGDLVPCRAAGCDWSRLQSACVEPVDRGQIMVGGLMIAIGSCVFVWAAGWARRNFSAVATLRRKGIPVVASVVGKEQEEVRPSHLS